MSHAQLTGVAQERTHAGIVPKRSEGFRDPAWRGTRFLEQSSGGVSSGEWDAPKPTLLGTHLVDKAGKPLDASTAVAFGEHVPEE